MTLTEMKAILVGVDLIVMGWNVGNKAYFSAIAVTDFDDDTFEMLFENGSFRKTRRNERILKSCIIKETTMDIIDSLEGDNRGYQAESYLFGKPNKSNSKIDGVLAGMTVQLKTSFTRGNGTSHSNAL